MMFPELHRLPVKKIVPPTPNIYKGKLLQFRGGMRKLNFCAKQVQRLKVDDAIVHMEFSPKGASENIKKLLTTVRDRTITSGNGSPLYIKRCFVGKGKYIKEIDYKAKGRFGIKRQYFSNLFVELQDQPVPTKKSAKQRRIEKHKKLSLLPPPILFNV